MGGQVGKVQPLRPASAYSGDQRVTGTIGEPNVRNPSEYAVRRYYEFAPSDHPWVRGNADSDV